VHYDFTDLQLLTAIVETGGIAAAARRTNLSVPAVSKRIKAMEEGTGTALLTRTAQGSLPTSAGRELGAYARAVLRQAERLDGAIGAMKGRVGGKLKLLANSNAIVSFLPDILACFLAQNPDVVLDVVELMSDEIARALRAGDGDVGIAAHNLGVAAKDVEDMHDLEIIPFRRDRLVLIVPPSHPLGELDTVGLHDIPEEGLIGLDDHAAFQKALMRDAAMLGRKLTIRVRLRSFDGVCRMVAAGAGIAVVPDSVVPCANVHAVPLSDPWADRELVICLPRHVPRTPLVGRLLAALQSNATERDVHW
jgi:molybdate transport repressor ModE-like protein